MERPTKLLQDIFRAAKQSSIIVPLSLIPLLCVIWFAHEKTQAMQLLEQQIATLEKKAIFQKNQKEKRDFVWGRSQNASPHYLEQKIEALALLSCELKHLQALCRQYPDNQVLRERLNFLQGDGNRIHWIVSTQRDGDSFHEKEFIMEKRVQMDDVDLKNFLAAVEGGDDGAEKKQPLLIIKEFDLLRQREKADENVYNMQAEIIQRLP